VQDYQRAFADFLWEAGALRIGDFTLKSGRRSPLFLNTGLLDTGSRLAHLGEAYAATLIGRVGAEAFDVVFGPAYKGIPLAVTTTIALARQGVDKVALSDRKEAKTHGAEAAAGAAAGRLLGRPPAADAAFVLVDDVLTDGATKVEAVRLLRELSPKGRIVALLIVLDRQEVRADGADALASFAKETGVPVHPVLSVTEVVDHLHATGRIPPAERERCRAYWAQYGTPSARAWAGSP
jgi:orotate phosphoribosyltransferase